MTVTAVENGFWILKKPTPDCKMCQVFFATLKDFANLIRDRKLHEDEVLGTYKSYEEAENHAAFIYDVNEIGDENKSKIVDLRERITSLATLDTIKEIVDAVRCFDNIADEFGLDRDMFWKSQMAGPSILQVKIGC